MIPPTVAPPFNAGSIASIWPWRANSAWASASRTPASSTAVKSPTLCSSTRSSPPVSTTAAPSTGGPQSFVPPPRSPASKPLRQAGRLERVLPVLARYLAAETRRRHHLAGVREAGGIERAAQPLERVEVGLAEHLRHVLLLVDADAVLAGDRAARLQARVEDPAGELLGALGLALVAAVEADERMEVAVAGVEDVGDDHPVLLRQRVDRLQHLGQLGARDHAVLHEVVRRHPAHRRERGLARSE